MGEKMNENKRYQLIKNFGDYHLTNGEKHICYDLCSPTMTKENWNNVVKELNRLYEETEELKRNLAYLLTAHEATVKNNMEEIKRLRSENRQLMTQLIMSKKRPYEDRGI